MGKLVLIILLDDECVKGITYLGNKTFRVSLRIRRRQLFKAKGANRQYKTCTQSDRYSHYFIAKLRDATLKLLLLCLLFSVPLPSFALTSNLHFQLTVTLTNLYFKIEIDNLLTVF